MKILTSIADRLQKKNARIRPLAFHSFNSLSFSGFHIILNLIPDNTGWSPTCAERAFVSFKTESASKRPQM